jgi:HAMP domain-containing protein
MMQAERIKQLTFAFGLLSLLMGLVFSYFAAVSNYRPIQNLVRQFSFSTGKTAKELTPEGRARPPNGSPDPPTNAPPTQSV